MHLTLPESSLRGRARNGYALSLVLHAGVVTLLLVQHGNSPILPDEPKVIPLHFSPPPPPADAVPTPPLRGALASGPSVALPSLNIPITIPDHIPAVSLSDSPFDAASFAQRAFASSDAGTTPLAVTTIDVPLTAERVDRQVESLPGNPVPWYPVALEHMGVEGSVTVRFVVDTLGRLRDGTVEIVRSTHPLFERAVRDALPRMRFRPAMLGNQKVAQLVEQNFQFAIKR